jgi:hypothetical protein
MVITKPLENRKKCNISLNVTKVTFRYIYVIHSYQIRGIFFIRTSYLLVLVPLKIISKVKHSNRTLFPYKCNILVEAGGQHKVSHKMLKASVAVALVAYATFFAYLGKYNLIVHYT